MTTTELQCYRVTGSVLAVLVMLVLSGCSDDKPKQQVDHQAPAPPRTIVVQIPASQWPSRQTQSPVTPPPVQQAWPATTDGSNPWAVPARPRSHGQDQHSVRSWGQPRPELPPQYVQPPPANRYRPLEPQASGNAADRQPTPRYRPVAPYDRLSGSSFDSNRQTPLYGGAYPGYYGASPYAMPGPVYGPGWPGPPGGWPGYW